MSFSDNLTSRWNHTGFTLVELLIVVSLVGILAGVTISIINPVKQRKIAEDGVIQSNLQKFALGIEAYGNANGIYPQAVDLDENNIPIDDEVRTYISKVPNGEPRASVTYNYESDTDTFGVSVVKVSDEYRCYKYHSSWGKIYDCYIKFCERGQINNADACSE